MTDLAKAARSLRPSAAPDGCGYLTPFLNPEHTAAEVYLTRCLGGLTAEELLGLTELAVTMLEARRAHVPGERDGYIPDGGPDDLAGRAAKSHFMRRWTA
ncbi:MAG: hypothetical protein ACYC5O_00695 [Anaerolineae bacterium]